MTQIRNKTGGAASIQSLGAIGIADGADYDLSVVVDGLPRVSQAAVQSSIELERLVRAGSWVILGDGGEELSPAEGLERISPSDEAGAQTAGGLIVREPWAVVTPNPGNNAWFDAHVIDVPDGKAVAVSVTVHIRAGTDADMDVGSAPYTLTLRRRTGGSVVTPSNFSFLATGEGGIRFRLDERSDSIAVQAKRRGTGAVQVAVIGMVEVQT